MAGLVTVTPGTSKENYVLGRWRPGAELPSMSQNAKPEAKILAPRRVAVGVPQSAGEERKHCAKGSISLRTLPSLPQPGVIAAERTGSVYGTSDIEHKPKTSSPSGPGRAGTLRSLPECAHVEGGESSALTACGFAATTVAKRHRRASIVSLDSKYRWSSEAPDAAKGRLEACFVQSPSRT